jgi:hypothetical protein
VPGPITLHEHTWLHKIQKWRPEVDLDQLRDTLQDPDFICDSRTRPGDWVFFCEGNTNEQHQGMRVTVRLQDGEYFVTNAYYSGSVYHGAVLWRRGDG